MILVLFISLVAVVTNSSFDSVDNVTFAFVKIVDSTSDSKLPFFMELSKVRSKFGFTCLLFPNTAISADLRSKYWPIDNFLPAQDL